MINVSKITGENNPRQPVETGQGAQVLECLQTAGVEQAPRAPQTFHGPAPGEPLAKLSERDSFESRESNQFQSDAGLSASGRTPAPSPDVWPLQHDGHQASLTWTSRDLLASLGVPKKDVRILHMGASKEMSSEYKTILNVLDGYHTIESSTDPDSRQQQIILLKSLIEAGSRYLTVKNKRPDLQKMIEQLLDQTKETLTSILMQEVRGTKQPDLQKENIPQLPSQPNQNTATRSSQQTTATHGRKKRIKLSFLGRCFSPGVTAARRRRAPNPRKQLKQELNAWIKNGIIKGEGKRKAKNRILKAFDKKSDKLNLSNLSLRTIPRAIGNLTPIKRLDLYNNWLQEIPDSLANLTQLKKLELSSNRLSELPSFIGDLNDLESLCVSDNLLKKLPSTIGNLTNLKVLEVANNRISELPETIGNLSKLVTLIAYDNKLKILPDTMGKLTRLRQLLLNHNQLSVLPESINDLPNLSVLSLGNNHPQTTQSPSTSQIPQARPQRSLTRSLTL